MAQNYLYMLEFVVDDLLITKPNECAPDEYPTCVDIEFRDMVFVAICDKDFGGCLDTRVKNGKCCLFSMDKPVTDDDKLIITVSKKKIEKCKFLLGATEVPVRALFDKVTKEFIDGNPYIAQEQAKKEGEKINEDNPAEEGSEVVKPGTIDNGENGDEFPRQEEFCPSSEISKKLLSLFDRKKRQTGNIVLVIRLSCMGPTIVSPFPFGAKKSGSEEPLKECVTPSQRKRSKMLQRDASDRPSRCDKNSPCKKKNICDKLLGNEEECPEDGECDMECGEESNTCSSSSMSACFVQPTRPCPGPEAFDEFEANFNGSGLTIRVLKDKHQVVDVCDSDYESQSDVSSCHSGRKEKFDSNDPCGIIKNGHVGQPFVRHEIDKNTGGKFINQKGLPRIKGNLRHRGNETCGTDFELPIRILPCEGEDKVEKYKKQDPKSRNCCLQVNRQDIERQRKGLSQKGPQGLEICHKKCVETDADIFVLKLGKKQKFRGKDNLIEVELKTPKEPKIREPQKITRDTQVDQYDLDAAMKNTCGKKKKGKKKKEKK